MRLDLKDNKKLIGFSFAWNGLKELIKSERNFKIHLLVAMLTIFAGFYFDLLLMEWAILILVIGLVLITEMINSAIEKMIDYLKPEIHPSAKIIKDIAAGAVLLSAIISVIIGLILFLPKIIML